VITCVLVAGELPGLPYLRYTDHVHCEVSLQGTHVKRHASLYLYLKFNNICKAFAEKIFSFKSSVIEPSGGLKFAIFDEPLKISIHNMTSWNPEEFMKKN
jgi:hypothetical protein